MAFYTNRAGLITGYEYYDRQTGTRRLRASASPQPPAPLPHRCDACGGYMRRTPDPATGRTSPCRSCGWSVGDTAPLFPPPAITPDGPRYTTFSAPDVLGRVVALQRHPHMVAELAHEHPVQASRLRGTSGPLTCTAAPDVLDRVVTAQRRIGRLPASTAPVRIMQAPAPCERCGTTACACPPKAPDVLGQAAQIQAARLAVHEQATQDAGLPPVR